jgi:hypothetical protein
MGNYWQQISRTSAVRIYRRWKFTGHLRVNLAPRGGGFCSIFPVEDISNVYLGRIERYIQ